MTDNGAAETPSVTSSADFSAAPAVLAYGRQQKSRWPRRLVIAVAIGVAAVVMVRGVWGPVRHWFAVRAGVREVAAWFALVHNNANPVPAGTLLYSGNPADFTPQASRRGIGVTQYRRFICFSTAWPTLREVMYRGDGFGGVPTASDFEVLFAAERQMWAFAAGTKGVRTVVVTVRYEGMQPAGGPQFSCMAYDPGNGRPPYAFMGGTTTAAAPNRLLTNLRIFAGQVDPNDGSRFALPFECDGGRGRFEFKTDTDVSDGGNVTPQVWIEWDGSPPSGPTTVPATQFHPQKATP